jgi:hypothetical protein
MANKKVVDDSPLGLEIANLTKKYKEAKAKGERRSSTLFYKTALRIAKARQKWEAEPFLEGKSFFQQFNIGFMKKKVAIFQMVVTIAGPQWCGSFVPWKKYYGDTIEAVLKEMLEIMW